MASLLNYSAEELRKLLAPVVYSASALAALLKVHPRTLARRSHSLFGLSTQAWADHERLRAAPAALIKLRSVKLAADALGLKHPQQLSMIFKKHYGCCPTQFLAMHDHQILLTPPPSQPVPRSKRNSP